MTSQYANTAQYFTLLKQENRFTLGLNTAKKRFVSRNASNKSCSALNLLQKTWLGAYAYLHQEWS